MLFFQKKHCKQGLFLLLYCYKYIIGEKDGKNLYNVKTRCSCQQSYGKIISMIEEQDGLRIINAKMIKLDEKITREHYAHLTQFDFFPSLAEFMMSGPCLALIVEGENAVAKMRSIMGPTKNAKELAPNSIRGQFAESTTRNVKY